MAQKVTTMVIKVDLACEKCSKKIKKVLCDIPYIQNQVYDQKANTVTITVECCSPEKVKKKIYCKGGKTVKGIEILKPPPPSKQPVKTTKPPVKTPKPKPDNPPVEVVLEVVVEPPKPPTEEPKKTKDGPKAPETDPPKARPPVTGYPPPPPPLGVLWWECYEGVGVGPCWAGYGRPAGPCYYGGYGRPVYNDSWGCGYINRGYHPSRCTCYICEENPSACTIM